MIRKAIPADLPAIAAIYDAIHDLEARGDIVVGWQRDVYPTADTAREAVDLGEMYVLEDRGDVVASGRINARQMPAYAQVKWRCAAPDDKVLVLHTLTVDPSRQGRGFARQFLRFYEDLARQRGCAALRIDTNARNAAARAMYQGTATSNAALFPAPSTAFPGSASCVLRKRSYIKRTGANRVRSSFFTAFPASAPGCPPP